MAKVECSICGTIHDEYWMVKFNTGRKVQYLCWGCYKQSQYEANMSNGYRQKKLYQIQQSKKRNK